MIRRITGEALYGFFFILNNVLAMVAIPLVVLLNLAARTGAQAQDWGRRK